jgi:hypothetical protein
MSRPGAIVRIGLNVVAIAVVLDLTMTASVGCLQPELQLKLAWLLVMHMPMWLFQLIVNTGTAPLRWAAAAVIFAEVGFLGIYVHGSLNSSARPVSARICGVFGFIELVLPKRIREEDLGDALEDINRLEREGASRWRLWLKCGSTIVWVGLNAFREVSSAMWGKKTSK